MNENERRRVYGILHEQIDEDAAKIAESTEFQGVTGALASEGENPEFAEKSPQGGSRKYYITKKSLALVVSFCIIFSGVFGFGGSVLADYVSSGSGAFGTGEGLSIPGATKTNSALEDSTGSDLTIQQIAAMTSSSVVEIRTETVQNDVWMQQYVTEGAGSGVVVSTDGYIITNNHVIAGAKKITVRLKSGKEHTANIIGTDDETDLAVLKIDASGLTAVVYGDSDKLQVGDLAVVIGNPLGKLGGTVSAGIISALDRQLTLDGKTMGLLQTDASINPGNSGGGLFNEKGQLVGVVVAKSSGSDVEGLGFAIPINKVKTVVQQLTDHGYVKGRAAMGITIADLTSVQNAIMNGVRNLGIYVNSVDSDNAKASGIQSGDMLHYIGDTQITSAEVLSSTLQKYKVGETIKITVVRNDQTVELSLKLSEKTN